MKIICNDYTPNEIIKIIREYLGLTQKAFGDMINKSNKCIQYYEYGLRNYDFELLLNIAKQNNLIIKIESKNIK